MLENLLEQPPIGADESGARPAVQRELVLRDNYPGVSLDDLNRHVRANEPLLHPVVGPQGSFFVDDDKFVPHRPGGFSMDRSVVLVEIGAQLRIWTLGTVSGGGGETLVAGRFMIDDTLVRMPSISCNPTQPQVQKGTEPHCKVSVADEYPTPWTFEEKPFAPSFVVEVDFLHGAHSKLLALDGKMREDYFPHGVQLGWLVDPESKLLSEYERDGESSNAYRVESSAWRDLDSGAVLPGLTVSQMAGCDVDG